MAEKKYRLAGSYYLSSDLAFYVRIGGIGAWYQHSFTATAGWYYASADGNADDLFFVVLSDEINAALAGMAYAPSGAGIGHSVNMTTGIVTVTWDDVAQIEIKFEHPTTPLTNPNCYFLHNALRLTTTQASTITIAGGGAGTVTGTRCHGYGLYPLRYLMSDLSEYQARVSQAVPDQGQVQTLRSAMLELYRLGIRTDIAYPRAALFNEYHALVDFLDNAASGRPFRVYPDKTVYTAYADASNPYGYRTWVLDKDSASWRPEPAVNNFYKVLDVDLKCWQWVE